MFVDYLLNDPERNATNAYLKVYPNVSYDVAKSNSSKLLTKSNLKEIIQQRNEEILAKSEINAVITKEKIISDIERISQKAEEKEQFSPALKGKELIGKELGMFRDQQINLNVSLEDFIRNMQSRTPEAEVIQQDTEITDATYTESK